MSARALAITEECPFCDSSVEPCASEVRDAITGERFSIVYCAECGIGVTSPAPRRVEVYYRERYYGNRHSFTARYCNWRRIRMVSRFISPGEGTRLLDVGCGDGSFLETALREGWSGAGVEKNGRHGNQEYLAFPSLEAAASLAPYDCVTMWHVLEHVPAPLESLVQIRSMMSREGVLLIAVPDFSGLQARVFGRHWLHLDVPRHLYHFTARSLPRLLDAAGFDVLRTSYQELEYDWFGWIQSSLNAVGGTPNVLFDALADRTPRVGRMAVAASYAAGALLSLPALGLTLASSAIGRGGTVIVAARPRPR